MTAYSPLGSPDRPSVNKDEPIVLNNPLLKKIADKHKTTIALVSCLCIFYRLFTALYSVLVCLHHGATVRVESDGFGRGWAKGTSSLFRPPSSRSLACSRLQDSNVHRLWKLMRKLTRGVWGERRRWSFSPSFPATVSKSPKSLVSYFRLAWRHHRLHILVLRAHFAIKNLFVMSCSMFRIFASRK